MMDERLICEVQKHAIIYNRQKSNMINGDKSASKELAWTNIAIVLQTDADSCKKRWKYLRERYVQQKKVGDSPSYEHLSRPYLEKMKFLDHFIQPRKSYRHVGHLLQSPNNTMHNFSSDYNQDDSSVERTMPPMVSIPNYQHAAATVAAAVHAAANNNNNSSTTSADHLDVFNHHLQSTIQTPKKGSPTGSSGNISTADPYQQYYYQMRQRQQELCQLENNQQQQQQQRHIPSPAPDLIKIENSIQIASSSSSIISSPTTNSTQIDESIDDIETQKRRRTSNNSRSHKQQHALEQSMHNQNLSDADEQSSINADTDHGGDTSSHHQSPKFPNDFLYPFYQQHAQRQIRNSEQLLGELVTSELLKMSKDRKKLAQKKILEVLFFDDDI